MSLHHVTQEVCHETGENLPNNKGKQSLDRNSKHNVSKFKVFIKNIDSFPVTQAVPGKLCKEPISNSYLVFLTPSPSSWCNEAKQDEGILTTDNEEDGENLQVGEKATHEP